MKESILTFFLILLLTIEIDGSTSILKRKQVQDRCHRMQEVRQCSGAPSSWHFDVRVSECKQSNKEECGSIGNRFQTKGDCEKICIDRCKQMQESSLCSGASSSWHFDVRVSECRISSDVVCGALGNRFRSKEDCEQMCPGNLNISARQSVSGHYPQHQRYAPRVSGINWPADYCNRHCCGQQRPVVQPIRTPCYGHQCPQHQHQHQPQSQPQHQPQPQQPCHGYHCQDCSRRCPYPCPPHPQPIVHTYPPPLPPQPCPYVHPCPDPCPQTQPCPVHSDSCPQTQPCPVHSNPCPQTQPCPLRSDPCPQTQPCPVRSDPCPQTQPCPVRSDPCPQTQPCPVRSDPCPQTQPCPVRQIGNICPNPCHGNYGNRCPNCGGHVGYPGYRPGINHPDDHHTQEFPDDDRLLKSAFKSFCPSNLHCPTVCSSSRLTPMLKNRCCGCRTGTITRPRCHQTQHRCGYDCRNVTRQNCSSTAVAPPSRPTEERVNVGAAGRPGNFGGVVCPIDDPNAICVGMDCKHGYKKTDAGCPYCECEESAHAADPRDPIEPDDYEASMLLQGVPQRTLPPRTFGRYCSNIRATCRLHCPKGFARDRYGCPICQCIQNGHASSSSSSSSSGQAASVDCSLKPSCTMFCEHGFQKGRDGCDICLCSHTRTEKI